MLKPWHGAVSTASAKKTLGQGSREEAVSVSHFSWQVRNLEIEHGLARAATFFFLGTSSVDRRCEMSGDTPQSWSTSHVNEKPDAKPDETTINTSIFV